jgi:hypothetical protein
VVVHDLDTVVREVLAAENLLSAAAGQSLVELIAFDQRRASDTHPPNDVQS